MHDSALKSHFLMVMKHLPAWKNPPSRGLLFYSLCNDSCSSGRRSLLGGLLDIKSDIPPAECIPIKIAKHMYSAGLATNLWFHNPPGQRRLLILCAACQVKFILWRVGWNIIFITRKGQTAIDVAIGQWPVRPERPEIEHFRLVQLVLVLSGIVKWQPYDRPRAAWETQYKTSYMRVSIAIH